MPKVIDGTPTREIRSEERIKNTQKSEKNSKDLNEKRIKLALITTSLVSAFSLGWISSSINETNNTNNKDITLEIIYNAQQSGFNKNGQISTESEFFKSLPKKEQKHLKELSDEGLLYFAIDMQLTDWQKTQIQNQR